MVKNDYSMLFDKQSIWFAKFNIRDELTLYFIHVSLFIQTVKEDLLLVNYWNIKINCNIFLICYNEFLLLAIKTANSYSNENEFISIHAFFSLIIVPLYRQFHPSPLF